MYHLLKRVYIESVISGSEIEFSNRDKIHHILNVVRLKPSNEVIIFNENSGEFLARIAEISNKSNIVFEVKKKIKRC